VDPLLLRADAAEMLDIARSSCSMRDNDNIYMGRLKAQVLAAKDELAYRSRTPAQGLYAAGHFDSLSLSVHEQAPKEEVVHTKTGFPLQARQITGHPAGPGIATGSAKVIKQATDLMHFKKGEILVCDSIDPNMTLSSPWQVP